MPRNAIRNNRILDLWSQQKTAAEICSLIGNGCTRDVVMGTIHRARRNGDPRAVERKESITVQFPPEDRDYLRAMARESGTSINQLASSIIREVIADDRAAHGSA